VTATLNGNSASEWAESTELSVFMNTHTFNDVELDGEPLDLSLAVGGAAGVPIGDLLLRLHYSVSAD
jgi:hypothetical protein